MEYKLSATSILRRAAFKFHLDTKSPSRTFRFFASREYPDHYQLVWQRDLFPLFWRQYEAVTASSTAFMVGLVARVLCTGYPPPIHRPAVGLALIEATIAGLGLACPAA